MLSFRANETGILEIHCDAKGAGILLSALDTLMKARGSHLHLRGPSAGGNQLNERTPYGDNAVSEVIFDYVETVD